MSEQTLEVRVKSVTYEAERVKSYEFRPIAGGDLPPFKAGSHINLHLAPGLSRSYSLVNSEHERHRYVVAVALDANSSGGSEHVHERLHAGDRIEITAPKNNFALNEDAAHTVLIAGGIGVTPIWCMAQRLMALGRSWQMFYSARTREQAGLLDTIEALDSAHAASVVLNFDHAPGGKPLDLAAIINNAPAGTHFYCCGPTGMIEAFERAAESRPRECVHVEYFSAKDAPDTSGGFTVVLKKSKKSILVPPGKTILDVVLDAGVDVPYSCMEGVCGTCEVAVCEGTPDHRDLVLSDNEKAGNKIMMICCSGSLTERLVLDL